MNRRALEILSLVSFSAIFSALAVILIVQQRPDVFMGSLNSSSLSGSFAKASQVYLSYQPATVATTLSVAGWLLTGYELFAERKKQISHILRTRVSGRRDRWNIYNLFKGRGGTRRLTILESLEVPRQRNEVAKITNTDWKEVDRNMRILESANLVRTEVAKKSYPLYELTEAGEDLLEKIRSAIEN